MSKIEIIKQSILKLDTTAIVNAANEHLAAGGGVCGHIFDAAGLSELQAECNKIGHCDTGKAVITSACKIKNAKYIIHAVGPVWKGGNNHEAKKLYGAYYHSLELAKENNIDSIGFPLISSGIFGYPVDKAWRKALRACRDFTNDNPDYEIRIVFAIISDQTLDLGKKTLEELSE